jgi:hypothetical protein
MHPLIPPFLDFPVNSHTSLDSSAFPRNAGLAISRVVASVARDVDSSNALGLAVASNPSSNITGTWLYRLAGSQEWTSLPPVSVERAFLLPSDASIRFAPVEKYLGTSSLQVFLWDQTAFSSEAFANVLSNSLTSAFSEMPCSLIVQRSGCDGVADSQTFIDSCGVCTNSSTACASGVTAPCPPGVVADSCGVCNGTGLSCAGCNNVPFSGLLVDNCGVCAGSGQAKDCNGDCFGAAFVDSCGVCVGGRTGRAPLFLQDCAGVCNGTARLDLCGDCVLGTTNRFWNEAMDCRGACNGGFTLDNCGVCKSPLSSVSVQDCAGVCYGAAVIDDCGVCVPSRDSPAFNANKDACSVCFGNNQSCMGCDMVPNSGRIIDECGICGGSSACLRLSSVTPDGASIVGGTTLSLFGSGFAASPNAVCRFRRTVSGSSTLYASPLVVTNRSRATCASPISTVVGVFSLSVTMDGSTSSNAVNFLMYSLTGVTITAISFTEALTTDTAPLTISGVSFEPTNRPACYYPEFSGSLAYPGTFINISTFACPMPAWSSSISVTPAISFNGVFNQAITGPALTIFAPRAVLVSATFNSLFTQIVMTWNRAINMSVLSTGCSAVFDQPTLRLLGSSSSCMFLSFTAALITLGGDARVAIATRLSLRRNAIFVLGEAYSRASFGSVAVTSSSNVIVPTAVLKVPQSFSACGSGDLTVSGRFSTGAGYAPLRFRFRVQSSAYVTPIEMLFAATSPLSDTIAIPSQLLLAGQTYFFSLQVINFLGQTSVIVVSPGTMVYSSVTLPSFWTFGSPLLETRTDEPFSVASVVQSPACVRDSLPKFVWTVDRCLDLACEALTFVEKTVFPAGLGSTVDFATGILAADSRYRLQGFFVNTNGNTTTSVLSTSSLLAVAPPPLSCHVLGGNRQVSSLTSFVLQVLRVGDPSLTGALQWRCERADGVACSMTASPVPANASLMFNSSFGSDLQVLANTLSAGKHTFTARLRVGNAVTTCASSITIVATAPSSNVFVEPIVYPIVWNAPVLLRGWISSPSWCTYRWICANEGGQDGLDSSFCWFRSLASPLASVCFFLLSSRVDVQPNVPFVKKPLTDVIQVGAFAQRSYRVGETPPCLHHH